MADSALGSALVIPDSALKKIKEADDKVKALQDTANNAAKGITKSFSDMAVGTQPFIDSLDKIIAKLGTINASASNAGSGLGNLGQGLGNIGNGASKAVQDLNNLINQLSNIGGNGTSGIMQAVLAFKRLQEAAKGASGMNIAELKEAIRGIETTLRDTNANLTKADQDALIKRKKALQDELKMQQQLYEERAISFQKALDKMVSAEQAYNNKQKKLYADRSKDYQSRNYQQNTTYQGALDFSSTANTLNRQVRAIEYLKEARMKLSTSDADYKQKLATLNAAIDEHNKKLKEAGVNSRALAEQTSYMAGYISRWAQRMAFAFSMGSIKSFVEQIADVRGQFELSERSLEAILQNKPKADEIFNKTVELAVKSPFRIKDLVDYTRQLSAYRIESDKLYDTTKRLADVSAGLGVDMGRLILAYGQVKAAAYLRGSEVRQFTEAGINMYGELQQYFKEVKGEAYTTAQIVDMISKRKVTFEDVEAIFQRMTDKGGTFYNMQEIQAETLQGKISNLKDAFDVMLNDIGKANEGTFKGLISGATTLLNHWETIASVGKDLIGVLALIMLQSNKTGVSLKEMWANTGFTAYSIKGKGAVGILANSFRTLGSAAKSAGIMIKDALVSNLPLLAFTTLASLVWNAVSAYNSFHDEQEKIINETIDAKKRLGELSAEYERIKDKYTKDKGGGFLEVIDKNKFQEESKDVLDSLNDELKARKLEIPIEVKEPTPANIDKAIQASQKKLDAFIQMAQDAKSYINGEDNSFWNSDNLNVMGISLWADSFSKDMKQLDDAANDVRQFASRAQTAIDALGEGYDKLSAKSKAAYDSIKDGAKPGELDVEYLQRVNKVMGQIFDNEANNSSFKEYADKLRKQLYGLGDNLGAVLGGSFKSAKEEATHELQGLFNNINGIWGGFLKTMKPAEIKVFWDNVATQNNLNELQKKILMTIASKVYHFKVDSDQQSMNAAKQKVYSFMDDLQAEADRRKIKISLDVIDPKDALSTVKGFQSSAKDIKELIDQINRGQIQWFHGSNLGIKQTMKWSRGNAGVNTVFDKKTAISFLREQLRNTLTKNALAGGLDPFATKDGGKTNNKNDKAQRDILSERISLLKEMNQQYEKLDKYLDDDTAAAQVMKQYADNLKFVGMPADVMKGFVPDKQGLIAALKKIEPTITDFKKRAQLKNDIIELQVQLHTEYMQQQLDDVKNEISNAFDNLELYKKLKGEGLSDGIIKGMFGDLTSSFNEVRAKINDEFKAKFGDKSKWSTDIAKQWQEQMDNLDKKVKQDQVNQAQELFKNYKTNLTERLQLYKWYYEELNKIQNNSYISKEKEVQEQMVENLKAQFRKKSADIDWKEFQNTDTYVSIFENLDHTSTKALDYMIDRLYKMREQLKGLDPTQVKAITEQIEEMEQTRNARNPFKAFTSGLKEMIKANKDFKKLGGMKEWVSKNKQNDTEKDDIEASDDRVAQLEAEVKQSEILNGVDDERSKSLKLNLNFEKATLAAKKAQNTETQKQVDKLNNAKDASEKAENKFANSVQNITSTVSAMATAFNGLFEALGGSDAQLENAMSIVDNAGQAIGSFYSKNWAGVASGVMGVATGLAKIFTNESGIDKEIERQERAVNSLQRAYEKLKQSMDDAFDIERLYNYKQESVETLKAEQASYEAMIEAEKGRKNPDDSKIQEWRNQIEDLDDTIKELEESLTEQMGGFGSQSNYKAAAEAFAEAWVDAYNEGSDALEALDDKFDEYIQNLITKQATQRVVGRLIKPLLDEIDNAVSEDSEGGNNGLELTKDELARIKELGKTATANIDEALSSLMEVLDYKPKGSSNISALQQGIQSVTESTAQALESILNSMRWYLATQQADVRIIRDTLLERLGTSINSVAQDSSNSPVLVELRLQTTILTDIRDTLTACVKPGHKYARKGIAVFMN